MLTVAAVAERLGVSRATVERCERTLRAEGHIERRTFNRRQTSLVALLRSLTIREAPGAAPAMPAQVAASRSLTIAAAGNAPPEPADSRPLTTALETLPATRDHVPSAECHLAQQDAENIECGPYGGTHPPAGTPLASDRMPELLAPANQLAPSALAYSQPPAPTSPACLPAPSRMPPAAPVPASAQLHPSLVPASSPALGPSRLPSTEALPLPHEPTSSASPVSPAPVHLPSTKVLPLPPEPTNPASPSPPAPSRLPSPRFAVAEAFEHLARRRRITRQMVVMFLDSKYPNLVIPDQALDRLIAGERRQWAWAEHVERLRSLRPGKLKSLSRMIDRVLAEGPDGPQGAQLAWASALYPHVAAELERRAELRDALDPEHRRREREEYMALAERELRRQKAEGRRPPREAAPAQAGTLGGACSPQQTPTQHELFSGGPETQTSGIAGLVARLERLKQEQGRTGEEVQYGSL
jgi:hypothetical protein